MRKLMSGLRRLGLAGIALIGSVVLPGCIPEENKGWIFEQGNKERVYDAAGLVLAGATPRTPQDAAQAAVAQGVLEKMADNERAKGVAREGREIRVEGEIIERTIIHTPRGDIIRTVTRDRTFEPQQPAQPEKDDKGYFRMKIYNGYIVYGKISCQGVFVAPIYSNPHLNPEIEGNDRCGRLRVYSADGKDDITGKIESVKCVGPEEWVFKFKE